MFQFPSTLLRIRAFIKEGGLTEAEVECQLDACAEVLLCGPDEWNRVLAIHNRMWSSKSRKDDGLRRKFSRLYNARDTTG